MEWNSIRLEYNYFDRTGTTENNNRSGPATTCILLFASIVRFGRTVGNGRTPAKQTVVWILKYAHVNIICDLYRIPEYPTRVVIYACMCARPLCKLSDTILVDQRAQHSGRRAAAVTTGIFNGKYDTAKSAKYLRVRGYARKAKITHESRKRVGW